MKSIKIKIKTGNATFDNQPEVEIGRILGNIAHECLTFGIPQTPYPIHDINGNTVGEVTIK